MAQSFLSQRTSMDELLYEGKRSRGHMGIIVKLVFITIVRFAFGTLILVCGWTGAWVLPLLGQASHLWLTSNASIHNYKRSIKVNLCQAQDAILSRSRDTYVIGAQPHFGRLARWISLHRTITYIHGGYNITYKSDEYNNINTRHPAIDANMKNTRHPSAIPGCRPGT